MKISSRITAAAGIGITLAAVLPLTASAASSAALAALPVKCAVHSPAGNCYKPGEFCPKADANATAAGHVTAGYDVLTCELKAGRWRWIALPVAATAYAGTARTWSGHGTQNTPGFSAPVSGKYIVTWKYSGNNDPQLGEASNFIIQDTDSNAWGSLPNDIAAAGSGSTEMTGAKGTQSFNVTAVGSWTITVKAA